MGQFEPRFQGKGSSLGNIFWFIKTRHILLSYNANCAVLLAVVLTQYRRVTDRQTDRQPDGIAIASTALTMRALRHAVETHFLTYLSYLASHFCTLLRLILPRKQVQSMVRLRKLENYSGYES